jgi:hypothetical protein
MRRLIAVAVLLILVSATNYFPLLKELSPDLDAYLDRDILCRWFGADERHIRMFDAVAEEEARCPGVLIPPQTHRNPNSCAASCEPIAIAAQIVERAKAAAVAMQERFKLLIASGSRS